VDVNDTQELLQSEEGNMEIVWEDFLLEGKTRDESNQQKITGNLN